MCFFSVVSSAVIRAWGTIPSSPLPSLVSKCAPCFGACSPASCRAARTIFQEMKIKCVFPPLRFLCGFPIVPRIKFEFLTLAYEIWRAVAPAFPSLPVSYTVCFALHAPLPHRLFLEKGKLFPASCSFSLPWIFLYWLFIWLESWFKGQLLCETFDHLI